MPALPDAPAVLVTDARWRKALSTVRALGRHGVRVIAADSTRLVAAAASRYVDRFELMPSPAREPDAFIEALRSLAKRHPGLVVFPMEDGTMRLVSERRDALGDVRLPIPPSDALAVALDKHRTTTHAGGLGIPVPRTLLPAGPDDLDAVKRTLTFPVVVKPRHGYGSQGITMVDRPDALDAAYALVHATFPRPLVQERIPAGGDAFGVSCLFNAAGDARASFVHRRLREYPVSGGPSTLRESVLRPDLVAQSEELLRSLGWRGFAMVEWKSDPRDGTPRLLEVNPRFVGSLELALQSGVDFPWLLYQVACGGDCDAVARYDVGRRVRWLLPGDLLHFLSNPQRMHLTPSFFEFRAPNLGYDDWARDDRRASLAQLLVLAAEAMRPSMWRYVRNRSSPPPA